MIPLLNSEWKKLITIRSTYITVAVALLLSGVYAYYVQGIKGADITSAGTNSAVLHYVFASATTNAIFLLSIIAILSIVHEYRYNTIVYTLAAANSRTKIFLAKIVVNAAFAVGFVTVCGLFAMLAFVIALHVKHVSLGLQDFPIIEVLARSWFYGIAYALVGFITGLLLRSIAGAIAVIFLVPGLAENIIAIPLKEHAMYLPFQAIDAVIRVAATDTPSLRTGSAIVVSLLYIVGYCAAGWFSFNQRDAN